MKHPIKLALAVAGLAIATAAGTQATAQGLGCGQSYTVHVGDSLSKIARRAYGSVDRYQILLRANRGKIGRDPSQIAVGMTLYIPCLGEDSTTASTAAPSEITEKQTGGESPAHEGTEIRILTAGDWAPFLDEKDEHGGMLTEIVSVAMQVAEGKPAYKIDFINDWSAHIQPLLSDHAYDLGIAWFRPNCDVVDRLSDDSKFRCNNLDWSEVLFEQIIGYYTLAEAAAPANHAALFGTTVCRPKGYSAFMLEEKGLVEPQIKLLRPAGPKEAFEGLINGTCDVVVLATDVSEGAIQDLGIAQQVALHPDLGQVASLHAVISKTHPRKDEILATLDAGIRKIKDDATWFRIVQRHMAEHRARTTRN